MNYARDVVKFMQKVKDEKERGTRTDFDLMYYQDIAGHDFGVALAERMARDRKKMAQQAGALRLDEITSDFRSQSGDGFVFDEEALEKDPS